MVKTENISFSESQLEENLLSFHRNIHTLNTIGNPNDRKYFTSLIAAEVREITRIPDQNEQVFINKNDSDINRTSFEPIQCILQHLHEGETDEACWLLFLYCYIGKHPKYEWNLLEKIYSNLSNNDPWTWKKVSHNDTLFQNWLLENQPLLKEKAGLGEYHKYSHPDVSKITALGKDIQEYINWIKECKDHSNLLYIAKENNNDPSKIFQELYQSMDSKTSFSKLIKFKYLTLIGHLRIFPAEPDHPYLNDFILSKRGAQHLFESKNRKKIPVDQLNDLFMGLNKHLNLPNGLQILQKVLAKWGNEKFRMERQSFKKYS